MKKTNLIAILLIIAAFVSCKHEDTFYTVKGRLITSCSGNPVANQEISLKQASSIFGGGGVLGTTNTDANGNFSFSYNSKDCSNNDDLRINLSGPVIENIPTKENVELGTLVCSPVCKIVYRIKVNNPYTINDTLSCLNITSPSQPIKIPAPLHDTTLSIMNAFSLDPIQYNTRNYSSITGGWCIRSNSTIVFLGREVTIQVQNCNTVPDTLTMVID